MPPSSTQSGSLAPRDVKSIPCRFFASGCCRLGEECPYMHYVIVNVIPPTTVAAIVSEAERRIRAFEAVEKDRHKQDAVVPTRAKPVRSKPCAFYPEGRCMLGESCAFIHDPAALVSAGTGSGMFAPSRPVPVQSRPTTISSTKSPPDAREAALRFHSKEVDRRPSRSRQREEELESLARELRERVGMATREREKHERRARARQATEDQRKRGEQERQRLDRLAEQVKSDATKTIQRMILGCVVSFSAGLEVQTFTTGFQSCNVAVHGLPPDTSHADIYGLFTRWEGIDKSQLYITNNKPISNGTREATVVVDSVIGQAMVAALDGEVLRGHKLTPTVREHRPPGVMNPAISPASTLTLSWRSPSCRYVASYPDEETATAQIRELNDSIHLGRRLKVEKNTAPTGYTISVGSNSIHISNLPASVTDEDVRGFLWPTASSLRRLRSKVTIPDAPTALTALQRMITDVVGEASLLGIELVPDAMTELRGITCGRASFSTWEIAKRARGVLKDRKLSCIGNAVCWTSLPYPISFSCTLPMEQYAAQKTLWTALSTSTRRECPDCSVSIQAIQRGETSLIRVRVSGAARQAVLALKRRVEALIAGEPAKGWHPRFGQKDCLLTKAIPDETGAYVRIDKRNLQVKLFGTPGSIESARSLMQREIERLESMERNTCIPQRAVRFFVHRGIKELRDMFGEERVRLDLSTRMLAAPASEDVQREISRILVQATRAATTRSPAPAPDTLLCPICTGDIDSPFTLGCGHAYCASCSRHYVASASNTTKFPLSCLHAAVDAKTPCSQPIPIPTIQHILPADAFERLLQTSFDAHVQTQHAEDVRFCATADCAQLYRVASAEDCRVIECPTCLATMCNACHVEEGHPGLTCEQYSQGQNVEHLLDEWVAGQGGRVKKCPRCTVPIEKTEGCNHVPCKCGAHICWNCLAYFGNDADTYSHLNSKHGGHGGYM